MYVISIRYSKVFNALSLRVPFVNSVIRCKPVTINIFTRPQVTFTNWKSNTQYDVIVIGGGIIGMATARELSIRRPDLKLAVVEKESKLAAHQSGHNSGVIHAGIYYQPGTLKAKLCVQGLKLAYKYFDENGISYKKCGKLIVAVDIEELPRLEELYQRALQNGAKDLEMLGSKGIKEIEPNCEGIKALWSPHTGIVDWAEVTKSYGDNFKARGGEIHFNFQVSAFRLNYGHNNEFPLEVRSNDKIFRSKYAVTCGGLFSDKLSEMSGCSSEPKIVPFRGEYLLLQQEKCDLVRGNIYPVPNPKFPFLGVHFTPRMDGSVWLGPNAVLAFKREGYHPTDFSFSELFDSLKYRGLRKLACKNLRYGIGEVYRGINIAAQVRQLQRYVPKLQIVDVSRGPAGVRAQALSNNGSLVDDFVFDTGSGDLGQRILHIRNAPSPGATSSLAIADMVVDRVQESFKL